MGKPALELSQYIVSAEDDLAVYLFGLLLGGRGTAGAWARLDAIWMDLTPGPIHDAASIALDGEA